ncbi:MAG TPA: hypothetical protein ENK08_04570 [Chloroflexi bacterium]|nr:hypothetical protein [Chloroflexota bacterium]
MKAREKETHFTPQPEEERLAAFTDRLLSGLPSEDRPPLADVVEILARTLHRQEVPPRVRARLRQRLAMEWKRQQHRRLPRGLVWRPWQRLLWAAVGLVFAGTLAILILSPTTRAELAATTVSTAGGKVLLVLGAAALLSLTAWLLRRR